MTKNNQIFVLVVLVVAAYAIWWGTAGQSPSEDVVITEETMDLESALKNIETDAITVTQAQSFEISQTTLIQFIMPNNGATGRDFIREALCVARPFVPEGYRIRIAGNNSANMGLVIVGVSAETLASLPCPFDGDLSEIAESYSEATGLR